MRPVILYLEIFVCMFAVDAARDEPPAADLWSCAACGGVPSLAREGLVQTPRWSRTGARFNTQLSSKSTSSKCEIYLLQKWKQYFMKTFYTKDLHNLKPRAKLSESLPWTHHLYFGDKTFFTNGSKSTQRETQGITCKCTGITISFIARWDTAQMASGSTSCGFTHHRVREWEQLSANMAVSNYSINALNQLFLVSVE